MPPSYQGRLSIASALLAGSVFRYDDGVWEFDPFELVYDEIDIGQWSLTIDGLEFSDSP